MINLRFYLLAVGSVGVAIVVGLVVGSVLLRGPGPATVRGQADSATAENTDLRAACVNTRWCG